MCVYDHTHDYCSYINDCHRADDRIPKLSSEIRKDLEVSAPQMVHNTAAWGGIHHLDPMVSGYLPDVFLNHLDSMPPSTPVADLLISSSPASLPDLWTAAPNQQTEYLLQPVVS